MKITRIKRVAAASLVLLFLGFTQLAHAQYSTRIRPGARVRVWIPEAQRQFEGPPGRQFVRGTVESFDGGVLRLRVPNTLGAIAIPSSSIQRLDVSRGVSRPASMVARAAGGAIAGAVTYALMNDPRRKGGPHYRRDWRAAGVGAEWGAGIGAMVGLLFPFEIWQRVRR